MKKNKKKTGSRSETKTTIRRSEVGVVEAGGPADIEESRILGVKAPQRKMTREQKEALKIFSDYAEKPYLAEGSSRDEKTQEGGSASTYVTHSQVGRLTVNNYLGKKSKNRAYFVKYQNGKKETKTPKMKHEKAPVIFCFTPFAAVEEVYRPLFKVFNTVYLLNLPKVEINDAAPISMKDVKHFIDAVKQEMKSIQKKGPYFLWGCSWSGSLAYALASELKKQDADVTLALMDSVSYEQMKTFNHEGWGQQLTTSIHEIFDYYQLPKFVAETVRHKNNPHATFDDLIQRANQQVKASLSKERQRKKKEACLFALENLLSAFVLTHIIQKKRLKGSCNPKPFILYHSENAPMTSAQSASSSTIPCYGVQPSDYQRENIATTNHFSMLKNKDFITSLKGHFPYPLHTDKLFLFQSQLKQTFKEIKLWRYLIGELAPIAEHYVEQTFRILEMPTLKSKNRPPKKNLNASQPSQSDLGLFSRMHPAMVGSQGFMGLTSLHPMRGIHSWWESDMLFPHDDDFMHSEFMDGTLGLARRYLQSMPYANPRVMMRYESDGESTDRSEQTLFSQPLTLAEIFSPQKMSDEPTATPLYPRKILIHSQQGSGKTTFVEQMKYYWATSGFDTSSQDKSHPRFDLLIPIQLKLLNEEHFQNQNELLKAQIIRAYKIQSQGVNQPLEDILNEIVEKQPEKVLFVLDGLNELNKRGANYTLIKHILNHDKYYVIVTSTIPDQEHRYDLILDLESFDDHKVEDFVRRFFINSPKAEQNVKRVMNALKHNVQLRQLARIPLQLELICFYYQSLEANEAIFHQHYSITALFDAVCKKLWEKFDNKWMPGQEGAVLANLVGRNELETLRGEIKSYLRQVAFLLGHDTKAMNQSTQEHATKGIITQAIKSRAARLIKRKPEANDYLKPIIEYTHFLTALQAENTLDAKEHQFRHQMFEYYFAAEYWVEMLLDEMDNQTSQSKLEQFIQLNKFNAEYHTTFAFVAGLLKAKEEYVALNTFFALLFAEPHDLRQLSEVTLLIKCLEECLPIDNIDLPIKSELMSYIMKRIKTIFEDSNKDDLKYVFSVLRQCYRVSRVCLEDYLLPFFTQHTSKMRIEEKLHLATIAITTLCLHLTQEEIQSIVLKIIEQLKVSPRNAENNDIQSGFLFAFKQLLAQVDDIFLKENIIPMLLQQLPNTYNHEKYTNKIELMAIVVERCKDSKELRDLIHHFVAILWHLPTTTIQEHILTTLKQRVSYLSLQEREAIFNDIINEERYRDSLLKRKTAILLAGIGLPHLSDKQKSEGIEYLLAQLKKAEYIWLKDVILEELGKLSETIHSVNQAETVHSVIMEVAEANQRKAIVALRQSASTSTNEAFNQKIARDLVEFFLIKSIFRSVKIFAAEQLGQMSQKLLPQTAVWTDTATLLLRHLDDNKALDYITKEASIIALDKLAESYAHDQPLVNTVIDGLFFLYKQASLEKEIHIASAIALGNVCQHTTHQDAVLQTIDILTTLFESLPIDESKKIVMALAALGMQQNDTKLPRVMVRGLMHHFEFAEYTEMEMREICAEHLARFSSWLSQDSRVLDEAIEQLLRMMVYQDESDLPIGSLKAIGTLKAYCVKNDAMFKHILQEVNKLLCNTSLPSDVMIAAVNLVGEFAQLTDKKETLFNEVIAQLVVLLKNATDEEVKKTIAKTLKQFSFSLLVKHDCSKNNLDFHEILCEQFKAPELPGFLIKNNNQLYLKTPREGIIIKAETIALANIALRTLCGFGGNINYVELLLQAAPNVINWADIDGEIPFGKACNNGHIDIVRYLFSKRDDINRRNKYGFSPIHHACCYGHLAVVEFLLGQGANINEVANDDTTPLYWACIAGRIDVVKYLCDQGADINKAKDDGWGPLHLACYNGYDEIAVHLFRKRADVKLAIKGGMTPFTLACDNNHLNIVKFLHENDVDIDITDEKGKTGLHYAAEKGHFAVVKYLCENGANVNQTDNRGMAAVFYACNKGHQNIVEYLCDNNANIHLLDTNNDPALYVACGNGYATLVKYLFTKNANINQQNVIGCTPFLGACLKSQNNSGKRLEVVEFLFRQGVDINIPDNDGVTPLHYASGNGYLDIIEFLVNHGVDFHQKNIDGLTPIHYAINRCYINIIEFYLQKDFYNKTDKYEYSLFYSAATCGDLDIVKSLFYLGADINKPNHDGKTPLIGACGSGHNNIIKFLCEKKAETNKLSKSRMSALHLACQEGHLQAVKYLCTRGANVNELTNQGATPLHYACDVNGNIKIVKYLIGQGANLDMSMNNGRTPLHFACCSGHHDIVEVLCNNGVNINNPSKNGYTALHYACQKGQFKMAEFLIEKIAGKNLSVINKTILILFAKGYIKLTTSNKIEGELILKEAIEMLEIHMINQVILNNICIFLWMVANHYLFQEQDADKTIFYYEYALKQEFAAALNRFEMKSSVLQNLACCYHAKALTNLKVDEEQIKKADQYFIEALTINKKVSLLCEYAVFLTNRANLASNDSTSLREEAIKYLLEAKGTQDDSGLGYTKLEYVTLDKVLQQYVDEYNEVEISKPHFYAYYLLIVNYLKLDKFALAKEMYNEFQIKLHNESEIDNITNHLLRWAGKLLEEYQFHQTTSLSSENNENADATSCEASTNSSSAYPFFDSKIEGHTAQSNVSIYKVMQEYHQWQAFAQANSNQLQDERNLYGTEPFQLENDENNSLFTAIEMFVTTHVEYGLRQLATKTIQNDEQLKQCINTLIENQQSLTLRTAKGNKKVKSIFHYILLMEENETFGTVFEITALAETLQRPIAILTPGNRNDMIFEEPAYQDNQPILLNYIGENQYQPLLVPEGVEAQAILQTIREAITKRQEQQSTLSATSSTMTQDV